MGRLAVYSEEKVNLSPVSFVKDVLNQKSICEISSYDLTKELKHLFVFQTAAYRIKEEMSQNEKKEIKELILRRFKRLSVNELYYAFKLHRSNDICAELKPYGYISVSFVATILNAYVEWKRDVRFKNNLSISKNHENQSVSDEEKKRLVVNGVLRVFDSWSEHKVFPDGSIYVYDVLYDVGLLPTDPEVKKQYYKRAVETVRVKAELDRQSVGLDMKRLREIQQVLKSLEKKKSTHVQAQAKMDVVTDYFKKVTREELEEILNEKL